MRQFNLLLAGTAVLTFAVGLSGCADSSAPDGTATSQSNGSETETGKHAGEGHEGDADHEAEEIKEALAELSDGDRAAAEKQKDCPVSGKSLGAMGKPIKLTVKDTDIWICCAGCKDAVTNDPDTYLAKLKHE